MRLWRPILTPKRSTLTPLIDEALLNLTGPDAVLFLQGQTTADMSKLTENMFVGGAFCDPKGRVLCDFLALRSAPDAILLRVHASVVERLAEHLKKFLMFSRASLERDDRRIYGLYLEAPPADFENNQIQGMSEAKPVKSGYLLARDQHCFEYWGDDTTEANLPGIGKYRHLKEDNEWYWQCALRGEARITEPTWGQYLPQDLNYDLRGWVSFKKGCYTGQEVIARLHWRGTPKRRLYYGSITAPSDCTAGSSIDVGSRIIDMNGKTCGSVVNAVRLEGAVHITYEATTACHDNELLVQDGGATIRSIKSFL